MTMTVRPARANLQSFSALWRFEQGQCFCVVRHDFQRTVPRSKAFETIGVRAKEALCSKNPPLDYVDELVEMDRLIFRLMRLQEAGIEIGDAIGDPTLETGKLRKPPRR